MNQPFLGSVVCQRCRCDLLPRELVALKCERCPEDAHELSASLYFDFAFLPRLIALVESPAAAALTTPSPAGSGGPAQPAGAGPHPVLIAYAVELGILRSGIAPRDASSSAEEDRIDWLNSKLWSGRP
jgi:hypothetical protein